jgi:hypothetical protein
MLGFDLAHARFESQKDPQHMTKCIYNSVQLLIFVALCSISAMGQAHQPTAPAPPASTSPQSFDLGQLDGVDYANNFFRLSLSIPREWVVATAQRRVELDQQVKKMVTAEDQKQLTKVEESIERSTTLLRITKLPDGQPNNAQFVLIAERLGSPSMKTGLDVIEAMREVMKGTNFKVEFIGEVLTETLSATQFGVTTVKVTSPVGEYSQRIYVTVKGDYALEMFFTYLNDSDLPSFAGIIQSVKFK